VHGAMGRMAGNSRTLKTQRIAETLELLGGFLCRSCERRKEVAKSKNKSKTNMRFVSRPEGEGAEGGRRESGE